ncbi:MAG: hypothetical protein JRH19_23280 [Deltaproteobacteria bacterium]|nr:hypothetical protein [Deltaproteobacteria bacterium]
MSDALAQELDERLRTDLRKIGDFSRIHPLPRTSADVPDDLDARLVVLPAEHPYTKKPGNAAETAAQAILESRGNTPRLYRNTLVFLGPTRCACRTSTSPCASSWRGSRSRPRRSR